MARSQLPWRDASRLLQKRRPLVDGLGEGELSDSVQAFLAWKAFVVVARGTTPNTAERLQSQELVRIALDAYPELTKHLPLFLRGLEALARQSDAVLVEWFCDDDDEAEVRQRVMSSARRRIRKLLTYDDANLRSADAAYDIGANLYAVRSAVIAHASVLTTGNLFPNVVGPFGDLVAVLACAGIAARASLPLNQVLATVNAAG